MKREKKVSAGMPFAKKDEEIFDGDVVTIIDEGQNIVGTYGDQFVIGIQLKNGDKRAFTINQTSDNNLIDAFGEDTIKWVGKKVNVFLVPGIYANKKGIAAYLAAPDWVRDKYGDFIQEGAQKEPAIDIPIINVEDESLTEIPF